MSEKSKVDGSKSTEKILALAGGTVGSDIVTRFFSLGGTTDGTADGTAEGTTDGD